MSEEAPPGTIVTTLKAYDPDTIGNLHYSIVPTNSAKLSTDDFTNVITNNDINRQFNLDPLSGQLRLVEALDRETRQQYILKVRADDGIQHTDINLIVQVTIF